MQGKLNVPQKTVLLWNELHPYNAVHVVRVPKPFDEARLEATIRRCLQGKGLTGFQMNSRRTRYHYRGGPARVRIRVVPDYNDHRSAFIQEVRSELNQRFEGEGLSNPFRFFVIRQDTSFYLGLVYYHLIAGGDSIIRLLRQIVELYEGTSSPDSVKPLRLYPNGRVYRKLLHPRQFLRWIGDIPEHIRKIRSSCRPVFSDADDHTAGFALVSLGPHHLRSLLAGSRKWGVTVNDIFLAALLISVSRCAGDRFSHRRRKMLSVASVVNIRKDLEDDNPESFGFFLGNFVVSHLVPPEIGLEELVKDIHRQTDAIKRDKFYLGTVIDQWLARQLIRLFFKKRRNRFYAKNYPLWGGVSNINLNSVWKRHPDEEPVDYFRAVSTGPATPLVLSLTTVNDILNIGVSYRRVVFSCAEVEKMMSVFSECVLCTGGSHQ